MVEHESIQCALAREQPGVLEHVSLQHAEAREQPANQGSEEHFSSISNDAMIINEDCNNDSANVSPSTVNRVQDDNIVNATQGGSEAVELQFRGDNQSTTRDSNIAFVHNGGQTDTIRVMFLSQQQSTASRNSSYGMIESLN